MLAVAVAGMSLSAGSLSATESVSPETPRITYIKILKGSYPEYVSITVDRRGSALYEGRKLDDPSTPQSFRLGNSTTEKIFALAASLNNFESIDLESYKKVANLGRKTFIYDDGKTKNQSEFNFSQRHEAQELIDVFERISAVAMYIAALEHSIQFDHLSLPAQLLQIQTDLNRHALENPEIMSPTLEKIARNPRFLHLAQTRAQGILDRIQTRQ